MIIEIHIGEVENLIKISYPCAESDYDSEFDDKIIKIANLLGFDFLGSGYNFKTKSRDMAFEKNKEFGNIEKVIEDLENLENSGVGSSIVIAVMPKPEPETYAK